MAIFHIEVHSRDRQIEHYIAPNCESETEAIQRIKEFYTDKGQKIGIWENETHRNNLQMRYLIFNITELPGEPVIYIAGEYRSQFPV